MPRNRRKNKGKRKGRKGDRQRGFLASLSPKRWRRESRAMANIRFRPEERALGGEIRASRKRQRGLRKQFKQYRQSINPVIQQTQQAYGEAGKQIQGQSQAAAQYAEQLRQRLAKEGAESAKLRGVDDPSAKGSEINAQAQLARINAANLLSGVTAAQGASQRAYLTDKKRLARKESLAQRLQERDRRRQLKQEKRALKRERGEYRASLRPQAREGEREYHLGLLAARDRKAARRFEARESAKDRRFSRKQARRERKDDSSTDFLRRQGRQSRRTARVKGRQGRKSIRLQQRGSKGGGRDRGELARARSLLRSAGQIRKLDTEVEKRRAIDHLVNRGVDPAVARRLVNRQFRRNKSRYETFR